MVSRLGSVIRSRKEHLERAREHVRLGNHSGAFESYQRAVDITPALALRLIKVLVSLNKPADHLIPGAVFLAINILHLSSVRSPKKPW